MKPRLEVHRGSVRWGLLYANKAILDKVKPASVRPCSSTDREECSSRTPSSGSRSRVNTFEDIRTISRLGAVKEDI